MRLIGVVAVLAVVVTMACGGPSVGPPGKSVVVSKTAGGTAVKEGVQTVDTIIGSVITDGDGGFEFLELNIVTVPSNNRPLGGVTANVRNVTPGVVQVIGALTLDAPIVGYELDPLAGAKAAVWAAHSGTLTIKSFDGGEVDFTIVGAQLSPLPLADGGTQGGATGTFQLDCDLDLPGLMTF
jgi:hypothetical protein